MLLFIQNFRSAYPALVQTLCEIFEIKVKLGSQRLYDDSNCPSKKEVARAPQKTQKTIQKSNVDIMVELWEDEDEIHPESADDAVADLISVGIIPGVETESNADEDCVDFCIIPCADAIMLPDITRRRGESRESNSGSICKSPGEKTISENTEEDAGGRKTPESVEVEVVMGELVDEDDLDAVVAATVCDSDGEFEEEPESEIREAETIYSALRKSTITPVKAESNTVKSSTSDLPHKGLQDLGTVSGAETEIKSKGLNCEMGGGTVGYTGPPVEFLMSWNRRIAESAIFFDLMTSAGFVCEHKGKCVYSFTVKDSNDI